MMLIYKKVSSHLYSFLKDLAGEEEDFTYEVSCCDPKSKFATTYRSKDIHLVMKKMESHAPTRNIFVSPFNTQYPEGCGDSIHGRKMISSNAVIIDIDSKEERVNPRMVIDTLQKAGVPKPTYLVTSGMGCHLWYLLTSHVGQSRLRDAYEKIRNKIVSIQWPKGWLIDDLPIRQQFRIPFSINHKHDRLVTIVNRGDKIEIAKQMFIRPEPFTKKELKRHRKLKKEAKVLTAPVKPRLKVNVNESAKNRFLDGSQSLKVTIKQKVCVDESKLNRIIQLLEYGKEYLSCRIAGEAIGISYKAAAKFLKKCVAYGYLELFESKNSANSYKIKVAYEVEKKKSTGRCKITGPGQSNKAMCRLARQAYQYGLDTIETVKTWITRYYHLTSGDHTPEELINTYENVYEKFVDGKYDVYGVT